MRIRILKPNLTVLDKARAVGEVVNDPDPNECHNLVTDGRAEYLTAEEDAAEQEKDDAAAKIEADKAKLAADEKKAASNP